MRRTLVSATLAVALLTALFLWGGVGLGQFREALGRLSVATFALALGVHALIYTARAVRFRVLLPAAQRPGLAQVLAVSAAHNLAAYVLPAKTGEATLVVYLRSYCAVPASAGFASLIVSRLLDLATLALALSLACVLLWVRGGAVPAWAGPGAMLLCLAALAFLAIGARAELLPRWAGRLARASRIDRRPLGQRLLAVVDRTADALRTAGAEGRYARAAWISLPLWVGVFAFYAILARGVGLESASFLEATFGSSLAVATNLLPINAFAAFGTQEAGWVLGFGLLGVERELALSTGVAVHLVQLFDVALMGLVGHLCMGSARFGARGAAPALRVQPADDEARGGG